jgi:hypothetical protein
LKFAVFVVGIDPKVTALFKEGSGNTLVNKFGVIKVSQDGLSRRHLHRKVVVRVSPIVCLGLMAARTCLITQKLSIARKRKWRKRCQRDKAAVKDAF